MSDPNANAGDGPPPVTVEQYRQYVAEQLGLPFPPDLTPEECDQLAALTGGLFDQFRAVPDDDQAGELVELVDLSDPFRDIVMTEAEYRAYLRRELHHRLYNPDGTEKPLDPVQAEMIRDLLRRR